MTRAQIAPFMAERAETEREFHAIEKGVIHFRQQIADAGTTAEAAGTGARSPADTHPVSAADSDRSASVPDTGRQPAVSTRTPRMCVPPTSNAPTRVPGRVAGRGSWCMD